MELLTYEPPTIYVEELMMEMSFLAGSLEAYKAPVGGHETMDETNDFFHEGDFSFD